MTEHQTQVEWRVIGASVRGAAHMRANLPNQDAISWFPESGAGTPLVVAVADGHGSAKCFRSDEGSRLAVATAKAVVLDFFSRQEEAITLSAIKHIAEERLPQELVRCWQERVEAALKLHPFSAEELETLEHKDGMAARTTVETKPLLAYGATLLVVLVTHAFILYVQLGDGDILTVTETGEVSRPLARDERLFANETTSLCAANAWRDLRIGFQALVGMPPALILLSTDGYANSFRDDAGFLKVGVDLLEMIRAEGLDQVNESLAGWLTEASQTGSGDDITLAVISQTDAARKEEP